MLNEVIKEAVETLYQSGEICLCLELLEQSLNHNIVDINEFIELIQEIALDNDCDHVDQALNILESNGIEIPLEVKNRRFTIDINNRLTDVLRLIGDLDKRMLGQSRVTSIIYDLNEYLTNLSDSQ